MPGHKLELLSANETAAHGEEKRAVFSSPHSCPKGEHEVVRKGLKMRISLQSLAQEFHRNTPLKNSVQGEKLACTDISILKSSL